MILLSGVEPSALLGARFGLMQRFPFLIGHAVDRFRAYRPSTTRRPSQAPRRDTNWRGNCGRSRRDSSGRYFARRGGRANARRDGGTTAASNSTASLGSISRLAIPSSRLAAPSARGSPVRAGPVIADRMECGGGAGFGKDAAQHMPEPLAPFGLPRFVADQVLTHFDERIRQAPQSWHACKRSRRAGRPHKARCRRRRASHPREAHSAAEWPASGPCPKARRHARDASSRASFR